jgi:sulfonate transport system ATP-binding protein
VDEALQLADRVVVLAAGSDPSAGAGIQHVVEVPGGRPRDRGDLRLAGLRVDLLDRLGVSRVTARSG